MWCRRGTSSSPYAALCSRGRPWSTSCRSWRRSPCTRPPCSPLRRCVWHGGEADVQRLRFLVWKEFLELRMEPRLFGVVIVAPILQLTLLGYAATTDVRDVPVVVADGDRSPGSRELIYRFDASRNFTVIGQVTTVNDIEPFLESGTAWLAVAIPAGYGSDMAAGRPVTLQVAADGTDANSTTVALGYATNLIGAYAREI